MNFHPDEQLFQIASLGLEPLTLGSQVQRSPLHYWGLLFYVLIELKSAYRT